MKRFIVSFLLLYPLLIQAGVIMKKSGERLEDVSIKSVSDMEIVYISPSGENMTIPTSDASAILYDDGRYEEIQKKNGLSDNQIHQEYTPTEAIPGSKEYNVYAYGTYAMFYIPNTEYDGITVEYRVIYKSQKEEPAFQYLGTTPFAYVTSQLYNSPIIGKADSYLQSIMEARPLVVPNAKDMKRVEFRLSKNGYKTVIVNPLKDAIIGGGPLLMPPLNKLKLLADGESNDEYEMAGTMMAADAVAAEPIVEVPAVDPYLQYQDGQIHKLSSNRYYFVDTLYNKKELKSILLSCPETERICKNARKWIIGGWSGVAGGAVLTIIGGCLIGVTATPSSGVWDSGPAASVDAAQISGFLFMGLGAGGLVSSFAIACVGHHRMNNAYKVYNSSCVNKPTDISMNFGFTQNGLGMRINF